MIICLQVTAMICTILFNDFNREIRVETDANDVN